MIYTDPGREIQADALPAPLFQRLDPDPGPGPSNPFACYLRPPLPYIGRA